MRNHQISSHNHQIINTDPSPIFLAFVTFIRQVCADFPGPLKKQPRVIAFLHSACAAGHVTAIVKIQTAA